MTLAAAIPLPEIEALARKVAQERLAVAAADRDRQGIFPRCEIELLGETGLLGLVTAEEHGGTGADRKAFASLASILGEACASTALVTVSHMIAEKAIELRAQPSVRGAWLPRLLRGEAIGAFAIHEAESGSHAGAIRTAAVKEGAHYRIFGSKFFITSGGQADLYLVVARTGGSTSAFLVEKETAGLSFGPPEDMMGLRGSSSREIVFQDCLVPEENRLGLEGEGPQVMGPSVVGWGLFGAAGISVGIARAAVARATRHAKERTIAGEPIGAHPSVQSMLADMIVRSSAAEALLFASAGEADENPATFAMPAFRAKLFASETAAKVADRAIQVMGGHGYCRDYAVERFFRDARGLALHFKTSEWLRQDIARSALAL